jgi:hypothetical protein
LVCAHANRTKIIGKLLGKKIGNHQLFAPIDSWQDCHKKNSHYALQANQY